jgi:hypothetical protein
MPWAIIDSINAGMPGIGSVSQQFEVQLVRFVKQIVRVFL